jgi:O-antigen/teichoic acid export membrane protein
VPMAALERQLNFSSVAAIELGGQVLGLAVSATLAWWRLGVWAPVAGQMAWQVHVLLATCVAAGTVPHLRFNAAQAREMLSYGVGLTASLRTWQLRTLVNPLLVGRFLGAEAVAFVGLALRIAEALGAIRLAAGRMAIAGLARLQNQPEEFLRVLDRALYWQVISLGPPLAMFALLGPFVVRHFMGVRWMPALAVYPFVAAGVLINSVYNLQASALFVTGRQWLVMRSYTMHVALLGAGTLLLVPRIGIVGYGWAELLACGAYLQLHAGVAPISVIGYRRLVPWVAIFLAALFVPS